MTAVEQIGFGVCVPDEMSEKSSMKGSVKILAPLKKNGQMTIPETPTSRLQQYRLTTKGRRAIQN